MKAQTRCYLLFDDRLIPVEVLHEGPRPGTAWVKALGGLEPFTRYSPGGPFQLACSVVLIPQLRVMGFDETQHGGNPGGLNLPMDCFMEENYENRTHIE